jgi:hypothetical protein
VFWGIEITVPVELADAVENEISFFYVAIPWDQMRQGLNQDPNSWIWFEDDWWRVLGRAGRRFHHYSVDQ